MNNAKTIRRQRTFKVDDEKVTIISMGRSYYGHPNGFSITIKSNKRDTFSHRTMQLHRQKAEDEAFARWMKEVVA